MPETRMDWTVFFHHDTLALKLLISSLVGATLGLERFIHGRPAGLRTHLLVCVASTLMMEISVSPSTAFPHEAAALGRFIDPTRIAAGVITGIGFLGAGVIMRSRDTIQGLTTAACIWMAAALGLAVGAGLYWQAIVVNLVSILALIFMKEIEDRLSRDTYRQINIEARDEEELLATIKQLAAAASVRIVGDGYHREKREGVLRIDLMVKMTNEKRAKDFCDALYALDAVRKVSLERRY